MEEWKTIFNVNLTSAQADQPLLVGPLLIEEIQMNNTMAIICSKMQILTQMFIKNLKKMLTESCTDVSMYGVARVADIRVSWLIYFPERPTKPRLREVNDANDSVHANINAMPERTTSSSVSRGLGETVNKALGPQEQIDQLWGWVSSF